VFSSKVGACLCIVAVTKRIFIYEIYLYKRIFIQDFTNIVAVLCKFVGHCYTTTGPLRRQCCSNNQLATLANDW